MKDLSNSPIDRRNLLNNNLAIRELYDHLGFPGTMFEGKYRYLIGQVARFYDVEPRTIRRLLEDHSQELENSGYELFIGKKLREFKTNYSQQKDTDGLPLSQDDENEVVGLRATSLSVFTFKAMLNVGMLLQSSEKAREVRTYMLDMVIDVLNKKLGGSTKYINQREEEYLPAAIRISRYHADFHKSVKKYVKVSPFTFGQLANLIYVSLFNEHSSEYRKILKLEPTDDIHQTMYSEVLDLLSSYMNGFSDVLEREATAKGRLLTAIEARDLFANFELNTNRLYEPLRERARNLMASRDMEFRDAMHEKLKEYIGTVSSADFEKFLGEKSKSLEDRFLENVDVFKRLKDR